MTDFVSIEEALSAADLDGLTFATTRTRSELDEVKGLLPEFIKACAAREGRELSTHYESLFKYGPGGDVLITRSLVEAVDGLKDRLVAANLDTEVDATKCGITTAKDLLFDQIAIDITDEFRGVYLLSGVNLQVDKMLDAKYL